jgi:hypothetical protein
MLVWRCSRQHIESDYCPHVPTLEIHTLSLSAHSSASAHATTTLSVYLLGAVDTNFSLAMFSSISITVNTIARWPAGNTGEFEGGGVSVTARGKCGEGSVHRTSFRGLGNFQIYRLSSSCFGAV